MQQAVQDVENIIYMNRAGYVTSLVAIYLTRNLSKGMHKIVDSKFVTYSSYNITIMRQIQLVDYATTLNLLLVMFKASITVKCNCQI